MPPQSTGPHYASAFLQEPVASCLTSGAVEEEEEEEEENGVAEEEKVEGTTSYHKYDFFKISIFVVEDSNKHLQIYRAGCQIIGKHDRQQRL
ncbi:hypothetical protein Baya_12228 [Bagarius yarrelli]|uniref:Uncharacterized protein n=1 Tax=Bagarius yarrelli TaxID=175774 RepID=A0A556V2D0_BAGYA|nr:hypothetical protein Baya_12228 [Bagarius yarrelli]